MSTFTPYFHLEKPEITELLQPDPFNDNFDIVDDELHNLSLSVGSSSPWIEIVNFQETNFTVSNATVHKYRTFTDTTKTADYYDKFVVMIYMKASAINGSSNKERGWYLDPGLYNNGTQVSKFRYAGRTLNPSNTGNYDNVWKAESLCFLGSMYNGTLSNQSKWHYFPRHIHAIDEWDTDKGYSVGYVPFEVLTNANGFGIGIVAQTDMTLTIDTLKLRVYGQRTWGDMRF